MKPNPKSLFAPFTEYSFRITLVCLAFAVFTVTLSCKKKPASQVDRTKSASGQVILADINEGTGLRQIEWKDGITDAIEIGGKKCRRVTRTGLDEVYVYFVVDPGLKQTNWLDCTLTVEYFDGCEGGFYVEYDGHDPQAKKNGAYTRSEKRIRQTRSLAWQREKFVLKGARFENSQNGGADFRLRVQSPEFYVRSVTLAF